MIIYRIKNKLNNKVYIGQTGNSIEQRFIQHCNNQVSVSAIASAIQKYGRENFEIEQLAKADTQEQLDELEKLFIQLNSSLAPDGYNLKTGGLEGSRYSDESKMKMSIAKIGTTVSEKTKQKMRNSHKTRLQDESLRKMRGQRFSERCASDPSLVKKFSDIRKKYWSNEENRKRASQQAKQRVDDTYRERISEAVKKSLKKESTLEKLRVCHDKQKRSVIRSDGQVFNSITEAASASNVSSSSIIRQINGKYKTAGGFTFQYADTQMNKQTIHLLIGAPGAGKSWVANQLLDKYEYISYDNDKKNYLNLFRASSNKPKLYDPTFKVSTIIRAHADEFNFIVVCISESDDTLKSRIEKRGGKWTDTISKRNIQMRKRYNKYGTNGFIGTSDEVLVYLREKQCD